MSFIFTNDRQWISFTQKVALFSLVFCMSMSTVLHAQNKISRMLSKHEAAFDLLESKIPLSLSVTTSQEAEKSILGEKTYFNLDQSFNTQLMNQPEELLKLTIPRSNGKPINVQLKQVEVLSESFVLTVASGKQVSDNLGVFYWGVVEGIPNSTVAISVFENELSGMIDMGDETWTLGKLIQGGQHILYQEKDLTDKPVLSCFAGDLKNDIGRQKKTFKTFGMPNPENCLKMYVEIDYDVYSRFNDVTATYNYVAGAFSQVAILFENENINFTINEMKVWDEEDPYEGPSSGDFLSEFNQAMGSSFNGDLAHLVGNSGGGGVAYLDVLCNSSFRTGYSGISMNYNDVPAYSWTIGVLAHEIGHNLGSPHTHDCRWNGNNTQIDDCGNLYYANNGESTPNCYDNSNPIIPNKGSIMSYCHLSTGNGIDFNLGFGEQPGDLIRSRVYNANCLGPCEPCEDEGVTCDDEDPCTENDAIDEFCNCTGTPIPDADQDGFCGDQDPDDVNPCVPEPCTDCTLTTISVLVDNYPGETSWNITNADGEILYSGSGYVASSQPQIMMICIPDGCYEFTIFDSYGDGICCSYGQGAYTVTNELGETIAEGGAFGHSETNSFCYETDPGCSDQGAACDDGNPCTVQDIIDANCNCVGTYVDSDQDDVCDALDKCPGYPDWQDADGDGIPDGCDECNNAGLSCDDGDPCTLQDIFDADCNCAGTYVDSDQDDVCDAFDQCPGGDDNIDLNQNDIPDACEDCIDAGTPCDDGDPCTVEDVLDANCECHGTYMDSDNDDVCDFYDICPEGNDYEDVDNDDIPDACDPCLETGALCDDGDPCTVQDILDADCNCAGTYVDSDQDDICDAFDKCPGYPDWQDVDGDGIPDGCDECNESGAACDDGDPCTLQDILDADCNCVGTYVDSDQDDICDAYDKCPGYPDWQDVDGDGIPDGCDECNETGLSCNDGDPCTVEDVIGDDCECRGIYMDSDQDDVCDGLDKCPGYPDWQDVDGDGIPDGCDECNNSGTLCDDGDPCTVQDILDADCNCKGTYLDSDQDDVCDFYDKCPGYPDWQDIDGDGIPDSCDDCNESGLVCDDGDPCTVNDMIGDNCECQGIYMDSDQDDICDFYDECPGSPDWVDIDEDGIPDGCDDCTQVGKPCDDGDDCTVQDIIRENCECRGYFEDSDEDGVCDAEDMCPGKNDQIDLNQNGIPDGCETDCIEQSRVFPESELRHRGPGSTTTYLEIPLGAQDVKFSISGLDYKLTGFGRKKYIDEVVIWYLSPNGVEQIYGVYSALDVPFIQVHIEEEIIGLAVTLSNGYDGRTRRTVRVNISEVTFCAPSCDDDDMDGVCNLFDKCPGGDDNWDEDGDDIPDACDECHDIIQSFPNSTMRHFGLGQEVMTLDLHFQRDPNFTIRGLDARVFGIASSQYVDVVEVSYVDWDGEYHVYGTFNGLEMNTVEVGIEGAVKYIYVSLKDGLDGFAPEITVSLSEVESCLTAFTPGLFKVEPTNLVEAQDQSLLEVYPNPSNGPFKVEFGSEENTPYDIIIRDMLGKVYTRREVVGLAQQTTVEFEQTPMSNGIYLIQISDGRSARTTQLVITNR